MTYREFPIHFITARIIGCPMHLPNPLLIYIET